MDYDKNKHDTSVETTANSEPQPEQLREVAVLATEVSEHPKAQEFRSTSEIGEIVYQIPGGKDQLGVMGVLDVTLIRLAAQSNANEAGVGYVRTTALFDMDDDKERQYDIVEFNNGVVEVYTFNDEVHDPRSLYDAARTELGFDATDEQIAEFIDNIGSNKEDEQPANGSDVEFLQAYLRAAYSDLSGMPDSQVAEKQISPSESAALFNLSKNILSSRPTSVEVDPDEHITASDGSPLQITTQRLTNKTRNESVRQALQQSQLKELILRYTPAAYEAGATYSENLTVSMVSTSASEGMRVFKLSRNEDKSIDIVAVEEVFDDITGDEDFPRERDITQQEALELRSIFMQLNH